MAENEKLIKVAKELNELYKRKKSALPYSINVIRELRANENANSRILRGLLQYSCEGQYPILQSFIELLQTIANCSIDISIHDPKLTNEQDHRIDLLIKEKKSYAIVVENKIWGARDQENQIENYIDYVIDCGIPKRRIFVVYLTSDGNKKVSDISLTDKAKKHLGYSGKCNGRFICVNFKDDIMPWLDSLVNLKEIQNEPLLSSSIILYLDFLKENFDERKEDIEIENELKKQLMNKLQINNLKELLETWEDVYKLQDTISEAANEKIENICKQKIYNVLKKKGYNIRASQFRYDSFSIEIEIPEWKKCWWAMKSNKNSWELFSGIWRDPDKKVAKKYIAMLSDVFDHSDVGYIGWNWHKDYQLNDDFWINIENHSRKFVNFIVNEIERVRMGTKDIKL
jgi:predicted XRE-type DNA-binding protein